MLEFLIAALIISIFWVIIGFMFYIVPLFFGAPYEGTGKKKIEDIIELANVKKEDKIVDLGSGDGRIVIAFGKLGIEAHGFEINPLLVLVSKYKIKKMKLNNVFIHWKSFWKENLEKYDVIILFQYKTLMKKIEDKLKKELKFSRIISYHWKFPNFTISKKIGDIYLYK
ncbi:MAG: methyltransferase domain-containing protein [Nanoarchaeota archaeon]